MLHTTLTLLRRFDACGQDRPTGSYCKLVASLPKGLVDDTPITLLHILESNGIEDAIWALRATVEPIGEDMAIELACRAAERVLPLFEKHQPGDNRPREYIEAIRAYGRGEITLEVLREKRANTHATYAAGTSAAYAAAYATSAATSACAAATSATSGTSAATSAAYATSAAASAAYAAAAASVGGGGRKAERDAQAADYRELLAKF